MKTLKNKLSIVGAFILLFIAGITNAEGGTRNSTLNAEVAVDSRLMVENWMLDENLWKTGSNVNLVETASEANLDVEGWMINDGFWVTASFDYSISEESGMKVEPWMVDESNWGKMNYTLTEASDSKIKIESWMTDNSYWLNK